MYWSWEIETWRGCWQDIARGCGRLCDRCDGSSWQCLDEIGHCLDLNGLISRQDQGLLNFIDKGHAANDDILLIVFRRIEGLENKICSGFIQKIVAAKFSDDEVYLCRQKQDFPKQNHSFLNEEAEKEAKEVLQKTFNSGKRRVAISVYAKSIFEIVCMWDVIDSGWRTGRLKNTHNSQIERICSCLRSVASAGKFWQGRSNLEYFCAHAISTVFLSTHEICMQFRCTQLCQQPLHACEYVPVKHIARKGDIRRVLTTDGRKSQDRREYKTEQNYNFVYIQYPKKLMMAKLFPNFFADIWCHSLHWIDPRVITSSLSVCWDCSAWRLRFWSQLWFDPMNNDDWQDLWLLKDNW